MINNISFLGTAGDSIVYGKQFKASGGIVIRTNNNQIHIDPGPGALVRAAQMKINIRETTGIVITNNTTLASNDLNALISGMTYEGMDNKGVVIAKKEVIQGNEENIQILKKECFNYVEKVISLEEEQKVGINNTEITAIKSANNKSIGLKILTDTFTLGYTSDTEYFAGIADLYKGANIMILKCKNPEKLQEKNSLNTLDCIKILEKVKPKVAIITGFGIKMLEENPLNEARKIQKATGVQTMAAKDGLIINPDSYSVKNKQPRLNKYLN
jgi:ribonuclease BN (tRNA processing enzyme)